MGGGEVAPAVLGEEDVWLDPRTAIGGGFGAEPRGQRLGPLQRSAEGEGMWARHACNERPSAGGGVERVGGGQAKWMGPNPRALEPPRALGPDEGGE